MNLFRLMLVGFAAAFALVAPATAQVPPATPGPFYAPNWYKGYQPTPQEWTLLWSNKLDWAVGGLPFLYGGCAATSAAQCLINLGAIGVNALPSGKVWIGNAAGVASPVTPNGDLSMTNTGSFSVLNLSSVVNASLPNTGLVHNGVTLGGTGVALGGTIGTSGVPIVNLNLTTPALGTPSSGVATNLTGTASGLTAGHVTTDANLTGVITSSGNATSIASQTGTGSKFVVDTSPALITPTIGVATATSVNGTLIPTTSADTVVTLGAGSQALSGGFLVTSANLGTFSSGTKTILCGTGPQQYFTNGGAFTLAAPVLDSNCLIMAINNGSAGAITFSGFTVGSTTGDALDTTNGHIFTLSVWRINGTSGYRIAASQ
jgi:hypothetical protein